MRILFAGEASYFSSLQATIAKLYLISNIADIPGKVLRICTPRHMQEWADNKPSNMFVHSPLVFSINITNIAIPSQQAGPHIKIERDTQEDTLQLPDNRTTNNTMKKNYLMI